MSQEDHFNALPIGSWLEEYEIKAVLGHGGFGITYLAYDKNLDKDVAIKEYLPAEFAVRHGETEVRPRSSGDQGDYDWGLERFVSEAQTLAVFQHASIVPVYRFFKANGTAYMVMEYQKGESLAALMRAHKGEFTEQDLLELAIPILDGLEEVHRAGYLHRDIKPGNVYIRENGSPVLLDFGAARHAIGSKSKNLTSIVTPGYAPLEQYFADGNQGPWTDIYALAAILYQAVAGDPPPEAPARVRRDPIVPAIEVGKGRFSEAFLGAIDHGLAVEEEDRPQSVADWREGLLAAVGKAAQAAQPVSAPVEGGATLFNKGGTAPSIRAAAATPARPPSAGARRKSEAGGAPRNVGKIVAIAGAALLLLGVAAGGTMLVLDQSSDEDERQIVENGSNGSDQRPVGNGGQQNDQQNGQQDSQRNGQDREENGNGDSRIGDEELQRQREAEEARRREEEAERQRQEEEARRRADEERRAREEAERRQREQEQAEEEARQRADEEERQRAEEEEAERRRAEEEERRRQEEEAERRRREEAARQQGGGCAFSVRSLSSYYDARSCVLYRITLFGALRDAQTGTTSNWRNSRNGARGTVTILETFVNSAGRPCRRIMQTITVGGVTRRGYGTACARGDSWQISG